MEDNGMKKLYKHFGKKKDKNDKQKVMNVSNIFYEMGKNTNKQEIKRK